MRLPVIVFHLVSFGDGPELEPDIGVSVVLSEVRERACVVTHDCRVVLLKDIRLSESTEVLKTFELLSVLVNLGFDRFELRDIS